tara:strand:+ start:978 stop:1805 length:828 start_codon:yes stop_codon:yes gene_type:complete
MNTNDLKILPPVKSKFKNNYKMELNKNLPDFQNSQLVLLVGKPNSGKTVIILNLLGKILKYYYEEIYFIGQSYKYGDATLKPLTDYYGNIYENCDDKTINSIIKKRLEMQSDPEYGNCAVIIDDLMSLPSFNSKASSSLARLSSIYRHVLSSSKPTKENPNIKTSGGLLLISNQRLFSSIPRNVLSCTSTIIIGSIANQSEINDFLDGYSSYFGGRKTLTALMNIMNSAKYNFLCCYLNGIMDETVQGPCVFLNFNRILFPSKKFPSLNNVNIEV